jgi:hypothetical protein
LKDEVLEKAKRMCGKNFEDWECQKFEEVKKILNAYGESWETLKRVLGENRKAPVKVGDIVPAGISGWGKAKVVKIYKDLLGNEIWVTDFNLEHIEVKKKRLLSPATIKLILPHLFANPDIVIYDRGKGGAIHYGRIKRVKDKEFFVFAVVGHQSLRFLTVIDKNQLYDKIEDRYWILWRKNENS